MAKHTPTTTIDIPPPPRNGMRGRLERLYLEYHGKAQALRIAADILDEHDRRDAVAAFPQKLLVASTTRKVHKRVNGHASVKMPIHGPALSLFLIEHLESQGSISDMGDQLARSGSPLGSGGFRAIAAPLGALVKHGHLKQFGKGKGSTWKRTAGGTTYAAALREKLEGKGTIPKGGYLV